MTCGWCAYEFCWACGESASTKDNHFGVMGGCGVKMMDESVKPGDGYKHSKCCRLAKIVGIVILCIILYPFFLVFYVPVIMAHSFYLMFA